MVLPRISFFIKKILLKKIINKIPLALIFCRLLFGIIILALAINRTPNFKTVAVVLFTLGLLSDIFDGIIARKLNISTTFLRRLDSTIDQLFFMLVAIAAYINCSSFFKENKIALIILLSTEALTYLVSFIKFKKEVATHAIASKIWTLFLFATIIQILNTCNAGILFTITFYMGLLTRLEIVGIILLLNTWTNDVPSIYHAYLLRKGKEIKRNKLFNG